MGQSTGWFKSRSSCTADRAWATLSLLSESTSMFGAHAIWQAGWSFGFL
jgi:hypothetical protein